MRFWQDSKQRNRNTSSADKKRLPFLNLLHKTAGVSFLSILGSAVEEFNPLCIRVPLNLNTIQHSATIAAA